VIDEVRIYNRALSAAEIVADRDTPINGGSPPADTTPPVRSNGQPTGTLPAGTTQTTLSLTTNETATCRAATTAGLAYASMPTTFSTTGGTSHSMPVSGLTSGTSYTYYVRCQDASGNANSDDFTIAFSIAASAPQAVTVTGIQPNVVSRNANTVVFIITGTGFVQGAGVLFENGTGSAPRVIGVTWNGASQLTVNAEIRTGGPQRERIWDVRVTNPDGGTGVGVALLRITP
jgi:hypothetical protein